MDLFATVELILGLLGLVILTFEVDRAFDLATYRYTKRTALRS